MTRRPAIQHRVLAAVFATALWLPQASLGQPGPAQPGPAQQEPRAPSEDAMTRAQVLFDEGLKLHSQLLFARAEAKYQEALALKEHPYIRYASSRALGAMGKTLEAYESLQRALPGLRANHRQEAESYLEILEGLLGRVEVSCDEPDTTVLFDGQKWLTCPGTRVEIVQPGQHVLVASKADFVTITEPMSILPGQAARTQLRMMSVEEATVSTRRWSPWVTWTVAGAGLVMNVVGLVLLNEADSAFDEFDNQWSRACAGLGGCGEGAFPKLLDDLDRAEWLNRVGLGLAAVGGAALVTGITLTFLNQPQSSLRDDASSAEVEIIPIVSGNTAGLGAKLSF